MPQTSYIIGGKVYQTDGSTVIASVIVYVKNRTTGESHNSNDAGFEDLLTNSSGEFQVNLASFTTDYANGDVIEVSASNSTYGADLETTTVNTTAGGDSNVNLVLVPMIFKCFLMQ